MLKIGPKMTRTGTKMFKIRQIDPNVSEKCFKLPQVPTYDKKRGTFTQDPTAGP